MRKVTASAVILTALTGCSQSSSIPSTQWSFEVPSEGEISSSRAAQEDDALANAALSRDAQFSDSNTASRRIMGPAFEQPAADTSISAKKTDASRSDSAEISTLPAETYGLASGLQTTHRSTRPDPVAQVRAYLRASGSPSALTSRVPYTSQVYLSSLPVPNQYYSPLTTSEVSQPAVGIIDLNLTDASVEAGTVADITTNFSVATDFTPALSAPSVANESLPAVSAPAESPVYTATPISSSIPANEVSPVAVLPVAVAEPTEAITYNDGLPQLVPGTTTGTISFTPDENISIGTAILNNLQQSSEVASQTAVESLPQVVALPASTSTVVSADSSSTISQSVMSEETEEIASTTVAYPIAVQVASQAFTSTPSAPTLASLTETMPSREVSPLVASYRANSDSIQPNQSSSEPLGEFPLSDPLESDARHLSDLMIDTDLRTEAYSAEEGLDSPLLDSFREEALSEAPLSTLYVPIAEPAQADISRVFMQDALDTLSASEEVSTSDFISRIVKTDTFASVLSSPALMNGRPASANEQKTAPSIAQRIPLVGNHSASTKPPIKVFADQRVKSARNAAITFAAKQANKRRQRLSWL